MSEGRTQSHSGHLPEEDVSRHLGFLTPLQAETFPAGNFSVLLQSLFFHSHYKEAKSEPTRAALLAP